MSGAAVMPRAGDALLLGHGSFMEGDNGSNPPWFQPQVCYLPWHTFCLAGSRAGVI